MSFSQDVNPSELYLSPRHRTILVVEDNELNREMLASILEDEGYEVLQAENGEIGLEILEREYQRLSVILLDVMMPVCDGFRFLERRGQLEHLCQVPVIVTTASEAEDDEVKCLKLGATDFVTKPYKFDVVINRILSVIRLRESAAMLNALQYDALTGLNNKEFFYELAGSRILSDPDTDFKIICCDIDNFKLVNERYGQRRGDEVLQFCAALPQTRHLPHLLSGRISGDVFAVLIREEMEEAWLSFMNQLVEDAPVPHLEIKYGVYNVDDRSLSVGTMCDRALLALEGIKHQYGKHVAYYDDSVRQGLLKQQQILDHMEEALSEHQFRVYFQPKHDLHTDRTGGAEALVRWIHKDLGFMSPGLFIPLFEKNGFITRLDFYIWEEVCKYLKELKESGFAQIPVSVNVSRIDFDVPDLADQIAALADKYGIDHSYLHIEVTESASAEDPKQVEETVARLHDKGFKIELDDFGSGYSSLSTLRELKLDTLKLDMSLIRQDHVNPYRSVLEFSIQLAKFLGLETVAEGVETQEECDRLRSLGADLIQGYYYSKPLPAEQFKEYLKEHGA